MKGFISSKIIAEIPKNFAIKIFSDSLSFNDIGRIKAIAIIVRSVAM